MTTMVLVAEAVPVDSSANGVAVGALAVLASLVALAIPVTVLVAGLVVARRVKRQGERLARIEARLARLEGDDASAVVQSAPH